MSSDYSFEADGRDPAWLLIDGILHRLRDFSPHLAVLSHRPFRRGSGITLALSPGMDIQALRLRKHELQPQIGRSVSIEDAAQILRVSRRTIYYRIRDGRLQTIRTLGGSQRVLLESIEDMLSPLLEKSLI